MGAVHLDSLDPDQLRAVQSSGHTLVSACPGSGKTRVLAVRAAELLKSGAGRLCAVSFTQDSAAELKERILDQAGARMKDRIEIGTFHAMCRRQLQIDGRRGNSTLRVVDDAERYRYIRRALMEADIELPMDKAIEIIEHAKSRMEWSGSAEARALLSGYNRLLANDQVMDHADTLLNAVRGMQDGSIQPVAAKWMLIDEGQDMDGVQYAWICEHAKAGVHVTIVGDDDQCHPPGTLILTAHGWVPVESLHGKLDRTRSGWLNGVANAKIRKDSHLPMLEMGGRAIVARRPFTGELAMVYAGGKTLPVTLNHKMLVRLAEDGLDAFCCCLVERASNRYALTVIPLGGNHRFGPRTAMWWLKGHKVWVLGVGKTAEEAMILARAATAACGAPFYACPKYPREQSAGSAGSTTTAVYGYLRQLGLDPLLPFAADDGTKNGVERPFVLHAVNLICGVLQVAVTVETPGAEAPETQWRVIDGLERRPYAGPIYSLSVKPTSLYAANGIVVHNSIYEWRNALGYAGMKGFQESHGAEHIILGRCYRCAPEIIEPASSVIRHNSFRQPKLLISQQEAGGIVRVVEAIDREDEENFIMDTVSQDPGSWAVMARANGYLRDLILKMQKRGDIPLECSSKDSVWRSGAGKSVISMLSSIAGDDSRKLIEALCFAGVLDQTTARSMGLHSMAAGDAIQALAKKHEDTVLFDSRAADWNGGALQALGTYWRDWRGLLQDGRLDWMIISVGRWLSDICTNRSEKDVIKGCMEVLVKGQGTLSQRIKDAVAYGTEKSDKTPRVKICTLHGAKGLEFDRVWIMACEEDILPHREGILEEERRLMYVGMTRAKRELVLSWTLRNGVSRASRFVREAGLR